MARGYSGSDGTIGARGAAGIPDSVCTGFEITTPDDSLFDGGPHVDRFGPDAGLTCPGNGPTGPDAGPVIGGGCDGFVVRLTGGGCVGGLLRPHVLGPGPGWPGGRGGGCGGNDWVDDDRAIGGGCVGGCDRTGAWPGDVVRCCGGIDCVDEVRAGIAAGTAVGTDDCVRSARSGGGCVDDGERAGWVGGSFDIGAPKLRFDGVGARATAGWSGGFEPSAISFLRRASCEPSRASIGGASRRCAAGPGVIAVTSWRSCDSSVDGGGGRAGALSRCGGAGVADSADVPPAGNPTAGCGGIVEPVRVRDTAGGGCAPGRGAKVTPVGGALRARRGGSGGKRRPHA